jgi:predicted metal-dependent peptidase
VFRIDGIDGESIVVDGNWVEKLRTGTSRGRNPADQYSGTQVKEFSRRKKLFGSEKEHLLQVIVSVGTFYSLNVPAERRTEIDALIAELEKAREQASS